MSIPQLGKVAIGIAIVCGTALTKAELIMDPYSSVLIEWENITSATGGQTLAKFDSDDDGHFEGSFLLNVKPFDLAMKTSGYSVSNWLTPADSTGTKFQATHSLVSFAPIDLFGIFGTNKDTFSTSIGMGFRFPAAEEWKGGGLFIPRYYSYWEVEEVVIPTKSVDLMEVPVSAVPEPNGLALMGVGLIMMMRIVGKKTQPIKG